MPKVLGSMLGVLGWGLEVIHLLRVYPVVDTALNSVHASSHLIPPKAVTRAHHYLPFKAEEVAGAHIK